MSWNETCALSHLQILEDDNIKVILLMRNKTNVRTTYITNSYVPLCLPFSAKYDDHGGIKDAIVPEYTNAFMSSLKMTVLYEESQEEQEYQFTDMESLFNDLRRDIAIFVYPYDHGSKYLLSYIYYHEDLYNILSEDYKSRKVYEKDKCYYELLVDKYNVLKQKMLKFIEMDIACDTDEKLFGETFRLYDRIRNCIYSTSGYEFKFAIQYMNKHVLNNDNIDAFISEFMQYILFSEALDAGRYGYHVLSGMGGQDRCVRTQRLIAEFILEFSKRTYEDDDCEIYNEEETIIWSELPDNL